MAIISFLVIVVLVAITKERQSFKLDGRSCPASRLGGETRPGRSAIGRLKGLAELTGVELALAGILK